MRKIPDNLLPLFEKAWVSKQAKRVLFRRRFICWHCRKSLTWSRGDNAFVGYQVFVERYRRIVHRFCANELGFDCRKEQ